MGKVPGNVELAREKWITSTFPVLTDTFLANYIQGKLFLHSQKRFLGGMEKDSLTASWFLSWNISDWLAGKKHSENRDRSKIEKVRPLQLKEEHGKKYQDGFSFFLRKWKFEVWRPISRSIKRAQNDDISFEFQTCEIGSSSGTVAPD